jgi:SAM-dependent methyltransferase
MSKRYDQAYFDHWYRGAQRIGRGGALERKVALAVAAAEYHLGRPLQSVLDVGCGEGVWRAPLLRLRPDASYLGLDSSEYAVRRYGRSRNLALVAFADLEYLRPCAPVDLLVCADVMHYLPAADLRRGLGGLAALCGGLAFIETYTREDAIVGDMHGFLKRAAAWYRDAFAAVGFLPVGNHCYLSPALAAEAAALERLG